MTNTPIVPLVSGFHHWDHHWYIWLPGDPVYEAVEVMAAERGPDALPLVWVFFTERDGAKRQVHYYNDARVASATDAQLRDIAFAITGSQGEPRGISASLADLAGRSIEIGAKFSSDARLVTKGAGLTNQIGHSGDRMLLMFFREKNAFAQAWHVRIADVDATKPPPGHRQPTPFPAAYSSNILVGLFPFGDRRVSFGEATPDVNKDLAHFTRTGSGTYLALRPDGSSVELDIVPDAALLSYRHRSGSHVLEVSFEPSLPSPSRLAADVESACRISLDGFRDLLAGSVHVSRLNDAIILDWTFNAPDWMRAHPLRTTTTIGMSGVAHIELRPGPRAP